MLPPRKRACSCGAIQQEILGRVPYRCILDDAVHVADRVDLGRDAARIASPVYIADHDAGARGGEIVERRRAFLRSRMQDHLAAHVQK